MGSIQLKYIIILPLFLIVLAAFFSLFVYEKKTALLDSSYWIRVNNGEIVPAELYTKEFSIRKIEIKSLSVVSTLVSLSDSSVRSGFKKGDLDFYGSLRGDIITGMTHYKGRLWNCSLDIYSPTNLTITDNSDLILGTDLLPVFEPDSCQVWPRSEWPSRNFTLQRVEYEE